MSRNITQFGFGILQLLVVVAACGLLSSFVILVSVSFQSRTKDAKVLQDINSLRTGMELYYSQAGGYPDLSLWHAGGKISCGDSAIIAVPTNPYTANPYKYTIKGSSTASKSCGPMVWSGYAVQFATQEVSSIGPAGSYCLISNQGIAAGICPVK